MGKGYFIYTDTEVKTGRFGGISNIDANKQYVRHYGNWLELSFMALATENWIERAQLEKELGICVRKLEYWAKKDDFQLKACLTEIALLKKNWNRVDTPDRWST